MTRFQNRFVEMLAEKQKRENRVIDIATASRESGVAYTTLQRWANDEITRYDEPVAIALCDYLECKLSDLIEYVPPQLSQPPQHPITVTAPIAVAS